MSAEAVPAAGRTGPALAGQDAAPAAEVRDWVAAHWDPTMTLRRWWSALAESGWAFPAWPAGLGGRGLGPSAAGVVGAALDRAGALGPPTGVAAWMGAPVVLEFGDDPQRRRLVPPVARGEELWCQLFSEPAAGSDLAGVRTRAIRDGEGWVIDGQKIWTSTAGVAERGILLARTDWDLPKHRGLSFFILSMDQPGVEVRPIRQLNGESHFNEVFLDGARADAADLIGGEGNGWAVALAVLGHERTMAAAGTMHPGPDAGSKAGNLDTPAGEVLDHLSELVSIEPPFPVGSAPELIGLARARARGADSVLRQDLVRLWSLGQCSRLTVLRSRAAAELGRTPGPESSVGYLAGVARARLSRDLVFDVLGPAGALAGPGAPEGGKPVNMALSSLAHGIQGGAEQIQRNIIGERILGLPREPQVDRDVPFKELPA
ncbi:MAG: acyl-CoA dehydrogenase family protein [Acidimicrobiales bacterium]